MNVKAHKRIISCFLILGALSKLKAASVNMQRTESDLSSFEKLPEDAMKLAAAQNLTSIEWAHAVNSQAHLNEALTSSVKMIEADIVLGTLINDTNGNKIPVMGHPPNNTSDISLDEFLLRILDFNKKQQPDAIKGVKLDFKSTQVFNSSLEILSRLLPEMNYPVWLNADILPGPVNQTVVEPVDPKSFFAGCKQFNKAVLSIGWTTKWGNNYSIGAYTDNNVNEMLDAIGNNSIKDSKHKITFPVRAGIAAHSLPQLQNLYNGLNETNDVTLTIWSSRDDNVDVKRLRQLIFSFGLDKVYLDVPEELSSRLHLEKGPNNSAISLKTSLIHFAVITFAIFLTSILIQQHSQL